MVTWPELQARGVVAFVHPTERWQFEAPEGVDEDLRAAVRARVPLMRRPPRLDVGRGTGRCDACGGGMGGRMSAGWCPLCTKARELALREPAECGPGTLRVMPLGWAPGRAA